MNNRAAAGAIFDDLNHDKLRRDLFVDRVFQHQPKALKELMMR
jgi:hypothetical protein